jgi:hypothetical protein
MTNRTADNRNLTDMEQYYLARIAALQAEVARLKALIEALQGEVTYVNKLIARRYA